MNPLVAFLSDFGQADGFVGIVKGAMLGACPELTVVDLSHEIVPGNVRQGGFVLASAVPYFPRGTVFLAVVDPGVGSDRRPLALRAADWLFVGPDNGLVAWTLHWLARRRRLAVRPQDEWLRLGRGAEAVAINRVDLWREPRSVTFHARDLFGPAAAHLAVGEQVRELGQPTDRVRDLPWPATRAEGTCLVGEVVTVDRFGNLTTSIWVDELPPRPVFAIGGRRLDGLAGHYLAGPPLVALPGSVGLVEIAAPSASAAELLGVGVGDRLTVQPRDEAG